MFVCHGFVLTQRMKRKKKLNKQTNFLSIPDKWHTHALTAPPSASGRPRSWGSCTPARSSPPHQSSRGDGPSGTGSSSQNPPPGPAYVSAASPSPAPVSSSSAGKVSKIKNLFSLFFFDFL